ncbi:MAG: class F sortase [Acidimicrobiales bacterium]
MSESHGRQRRQWVWWSVAAFALSVGALSLVATLPKNDPSVIVLTHVASTTTAKSTIKKFPVIARSRPIRITIAAIAVNTQVGTLGLQTDHEVMVPTNTRVVGWYKDGPPPGQVGSAVILGHVDSRQGPGVFFSLTSFKAGDHIRTVLANGTVTTFAVTKVVQYSKSSFPDRLVYGSHGTRSLQLVTCGGSFDHATGHYESNVVVYSNLVSVSIPKVAVRS